MLVPGGSGPELPKPGVSGAQRSKCGASSPMSGANIRDERPEAASSSSGVPRPSRT